MNLRIKTKIYAADPDIRFLTKSILKLSCRAAVMPTASELMIIFTWMRDNLTDSSHISIFQLVCIVEADKNRHVKNVYQTVAVSFVIENFRISFDESVEIQLFWSDNLAVIVNFDLKFRNTVSRRYNPFRMDDCATTCFSIIIVWSLKRNFNLTFEKFFRTIFFSKIHNVDLYWLNWSWIRAREKFKTRWFWF